MDIYLQVLANKGYIIDKNANGIWLHHANDTIASRIRKPTLHKLLPCKRRAMEIKMDTDRTAKIWNEASKLAFDIRTDEKALLKMLRTRRDLRARRGEMPTMAGEPPLARLVGEKQSGAAGTKQQDAAAYTIGDRHNYYVHQNRYGTVIKLGRIKPGADNEISPEGYRGGYVFRTIEAAIDEIKRQNRRDEWVVFGLDCTSYDDVAYIADDGESALAVDCEVIFPHVAEVHS